MTAAALAALLAAASGTAAGTAAHQDTSCVIMREDSNPLNSRLSPLDSISFRVGRIPVKLCYSRPSTYGRRVLGAFVQYGSIWRTGDNEPTMIHTMGAINFAGVRLTAGSYSLYTVPREGSWEVIVNRSTTQWGGDLYTEDLRVQEVGRAPVGAEQSLHYRDKLTFTAMRAANGVILLVLEWENSRVVMPVIP